ncbi:TolC family protein [candidate division KSB1 bacterium]|nr:TolC family protein [candidate division KSB1 bacterium]
MMILKRLILLLPALWGISLASRAGAQTITLETFLDQLQQKHPIFEKEKLTAQIEREEQNSNLGTQDWNVFSSVNLSRETPAIAFAGPERTDAVTINGGVERLFWKTGGRLTVSFTSGRAYLDIRPVFEVPDAFYQNQFALTYSHPLLKNRNGFLDKFQFELKQFDIDFSEVVALENQEDFLATLAGKFLDWVFFMEQIKIVTERSKLSEEELARTERKRAANLVDQVDVIRAEDAVRISKQNLVLVESQLKAVRAELAVLSQSSELNTAEPEFDLYGVIELPSLETATGQVKENSRLIKAIDFRVQQIGYSRKGFEETLKPDLSLVAQFNTKSIDTALGKSFVLDKPDWVVGLQFRVPLQNRTAKSQVAKTDLQLKQIQEQLHEISLDLESAVTNIYIQITELERVLTLNQEQIQSAKERTEEELKLYNQGRGELTFVIQSQDNEQNAKLTYAQNALTYHRLIVAYRALLDELLPSNSQE